MMRFLVARFVRMARDSYRVSGHVRGMSVIPVGIRKKRRNIAYRPLVRIDDVTSAIPPIVDSDVIIPGIWADWLCSYSTLINVLKEIGFYPSGC